MSPPPQIRKFFLSEVRFELADVKKGPLSHQKIKCSFLDYVKLLMIGQAIQVVKVAQNVKKGP